MADSKNVPRGKAMCEQIFLVWCNPKNVFLDMMDMGLHSKGTYT
jgi:hypothetical protein